MVYEKPNVDVVKFNVEDLFMTSSVQVFDNPAFEAASSQCTNFTIDNPNSGKVNCGVFGPCGTVSFSAGGYTFEYNGNHWKCHGGFHK